MPRRLNVKLLLWTLAALAVLGGGVHWVHGDQMRRNAGAIGRQAERALELQEYARAAELYRHYLAYEPNDIAATVQYATALDKTATSSQARFKTFLLLEQILRRQPDNFEIRQRAVQSAIDVGRINDAIRHLEYLLAQATDKALLEHRLGWCQEAVGQYEASAQSFRRAIAASPGQCASYVLLAELLATRLNQPEEAPKVMDAMIAANAGSWQAYLARARFHFAGNDVEAAATDVYKACELAPDNNEVLLAAAHTALSQNNFPAARHYLEHGLQLFPANELFYRLLASVETRSDQRQDAIVGLKRGLKALPDSVNLHVHLAELLVDARQKNDAAQIWHWLKSHAAAPGLADYVEGRLLMLERRWPEAVEKFVSARTALGPTSEWTGKLYMDLGQCYQRLGEWHNQVAACRAAAMLNPGDVPAHLALAKALLTANQTDEALLELRRLTSTANPPAEAWALLTQALLEHYQAQPAESAAILNELQISLIQAAQALPNDAGVACLQAEWFVLKADNARALAILNDAQVRHPKDTRPWTALAQAQAKMGQHAAALATLQKALLHFGPRLEIYQSLVKHWAARPAPQARAGLAQLGKQVSTLPPQDPVPVLRELANAMLLLGDKREAESVLRQLADLLPKDLPSRVLLFDVVMDAGRDQEAANILADLRRIEGEDGVFWRAGDAARAIKKAQNGDKSQVAAARKSLAEIHNRRANWARAVLLEAYLEEADGRPEQAMDTYVKAIALGERPPALVLRVAQWLTDHHRYGEAGQVLRQLEEQMPLSPEQARLGVQIALLNEEVQRAVALAQKAVPLSARDYRDLLWLAHVQWLADQPLEAGHTLEQAIKLAPRVPDVWVARVQHLTRTQQLQQVEDVFKKMQQTIPADRLTLTLARCLEVAGKHAEAEACYQQALASTPGDTSLARQAAEFYWRIDQPGKAEPWLRQLLASPLAGDHGPWARRQLALVLASQNRPGDVQQALALLDLNAEPAGLGLEEERVRCFVLAQCPGKQAEALRCFEQTLSKRALTADEQFLLAQIHAANRMAARAQRVMRTLLAMHRDQPRYVAYEVHSLMALGEMAAANTYLTTLEKLEPGSWRSQQLRAAFQKAQTGG